KATPTAGQTPPGGKDDRAYRRKHESSASKSCRALTSREPRMDDMKGVAVDDRHPRTGKRVVVRVEQVSDELLVPDVAAEGTTWRVQNYVFAPLPCLVFVPIFLYLSHRRSHLHLQNVLAS